ncbi:MAG: hypothetical protein J5988_01060, partial [Eubacterium sp.]|nr:hypothetical protein [Eubacterium sp.]MBP3477033.1 hypothetical protein [Lachnospiraceae bacterium]
NIVNPGKVAYKTGFLYTKWESCLQKEIFIYKMGNLKYKWESRIAIHPYHSSEIPKFLKSIAVVRTYWYNKAIKGNARI